MKEEGTKKVDEGTQADSPSMRLLRLWLWGAPLVMLALAVLFGVVAVGEEEWGLLAAMIVLASVAVGLFAVQWRLRRRISAKDERL